MSSKTKAQTQIDRQTDTHGHTDTQTHRHRHRHRHTHANQDVTGEQNSLRLVLTFTNKNNKACRHTVHKEEERTNHKHRCTR